MARITTIEQYRGLVKKYSNMCRPRPYTNLFRSEAETALHIESGHVFYEAVGSALCLYFDEGGFYRLHFIGVPNGTLRLAADMREVCCDLFFYRNLKQAVLPQVEESLSLAGLFHYKDIEQYRFRYGNIHDRAVVEQEQYRQRLDSLGLRFGKAETQDMEQAQALLLQEIGKYDFTPLSNEDWKIQTEAENILCIYDGGKIIAVYYYLQGFGRIVVSHDYRRKGLSHLLRMQFAAQDRWDGSHTNQYDWIAQDNLPSIRCIERIGAVRTGKMKRRYLKEHHPTQGHEKSGGNNA